MAKIYITLEEIKETLVSNKLIPSKISDIRTEGQGFYFKLHTGQSLVRSISPFIEYNKFEKGLLIFKISILKIKGKLLESFVKWLINKLKPELPAYIQLEYPTITVNVDILLNKYNIKEINVQGVDFIGDTFVISVKTKREN